MNALALVKTHLSLECIGLTATGLLMRIPGPCPDEIPMVYAVETPEAHALYVRHDVPVALRDRLLALGPEIAFHDPGVVKRMLAEAGPCETTWSGKSYVFPEGVTADGAPDVAQLGWKDCEIIEAYDPRIDSSQRPVFAVLAHGRIIAACTSSREDDYAGEAWVQTHPEFRRRGYARQVVLAWAHHLRQQGKIPFYSHTSDNLPSQALAHNLGLIQYLSDMAYA